MVWPKTGLQERLPSPRILAHTVAKPYQHPMLVIRLQRTGRTNLATYRIVVAEKARAVKGKFNEILGHYLPQRDPKVLEVDKDRVQFWVSKGAIPSETLARLLKKSGVTGMEKYMGRYTKQKPKNPEAEAPAAAPAPAAPAEAPAEAPADVSAEASAKEEAPAA